MKNWPMRSCSIWAKRNQLFSELYIADRLRVYAIHDVTCLLIRTRYSSIIPSDTIKYIQVFLHWNSFQILKLEKQLSKYKCIYSNYLWKCFAFAFYKRWFTLHMFGMMKFINHLLRRSLYKYEFKQKVGLKPKRGLYHSQISIIGFVPLYIRGYEYVLLGTQLFIQIHFDRVLMSRYWNWIYVNIFHWGQICCSAQETSIDGLSFCLRKMLILTGKFLSKEAFLHCLCSLLQSW